ncbi:hypothetical protein LDL36_17920 [Komagataeibacter sp. FNDCR1]|nr:hypothetical protein [Komagataeibacter sp. FNDCR1]
MKQSSSRTRMGLGVSSFALMTALFMNMPAHAQSVGQGGMGGGKQDQIAVLPPTGQGMRPNPFPSSVAPPLSIPASDRKMTVSGQHVEAQVDKAVTDTTDRLDGVDVGSGNLKAPEVNMTELEEDLAAEKKLRRMELLQKEAEAGMKLWGTTYDGKREMVAASPQTASATPAASQGMAAAASTAGGFPFVPPQAKTMQSVIEQAASDKAEPSHPERQPYPVVSSITGMGKDVSAIVLVPYVGVVQAKVGTVLPDSRHLKIVSIGSEVEVTNESGEQIVLGNGTAVPSTHPDPSSKNGNNPFRIR